MSYELSGVLQIDAGAINPLLISLANSTEFVRVLFNKSAVSNIIGLNVLEIIIDLLSK